MSITSTAAAETAFYALPRDHRWLRDGDSPMSVGGRPTDITQIGHSLERIVKGMYPVNGVPSEIASALALMAILLEFAEESVDLVIRLVSEEVGGRAVSDA